MPISDPTVKLSTCCNTTHCFLATMGNWSTWLCLYILVDVRIALCHRRTNSARLSETLLNRQLFEDDFQNVPGYVAHVVEVRRDRFVGRFQRRPVRKQRAFIHKIPSWAEMLGRKRRRAAFYSEAMRRSIKMAKIEFITRDTCNDILQVLGISSTNQRSFSTRQDMIHILKSLLADINLIVL